MAERPGPNPSVGQNNTKYWSCGDQLSFVGFANIPKSPSRRQIEEDLGGSRPPLKDTLLQHLRWDSPCKAAVMKGCVRLALRSEHRSSSLSLSCRARSSPTCLHHRGSDPSPLFRFQLHLCTMQKLVSMSEVLPRSSPRTVFSVLRAFGSFLGLSASSHRSPQGAHGRGLQGTALELAGEARGKPEAASEHPGYPAPAMLQPKAGILRLRS